ncbi:MAG: GntR family transcriptional regulator [Corynebacterium sp.]|nr:GntR family transcriptional regulator [Corynebacterium sp.]
MPTEQIHVKIAQYFQDKITRGELVQGDLLPSESEMCEMFNASRGPVRQAVANLRAEGLVSSSRGRRSVVLGDTQTETFESVVSNSAWIRSRGLEPTGKTMWMARRPAPEYVASELQIEDNDPVIYVHRVKSINGKPSLVEKQFFRMDIGKHVLLLDADTVSIHKELADRGVVFDSCRRTIEYVPADAETAKLLGLEEGSPLLGSRLVISNAAGVPIEYAEYFYPADLVSYSISMMANSSIPVRTRVRGFDTEPWSTTENNS